MDTLNGDRTLPVRYDPDASKKYVKRDSALVVCSTQEAVGSGLLWDTAVVVPTSLALFVMSTLTITVLIATIAIPNFVTSFINYAVTGLRNIALRIISPGTASARNNWIAKYSAPLSAQVNANKM
jgi:hypothetical protein